MKELVDVADDILEATLGKYDYRIEEIPVNKLDIDPRVQRGGMRESTIRTIVRNFNINALGLATVSDRGHGFLVILDGAHRWEAIRRLTDNAGNLPCRVLTGLTLEQEAEIFLQLNAGFQPTMYEKFRVGVVGNEEVVSEIDKIVHSYGLKVDKNAAMGTINAIAALKRIYGMRVFTLDEDGGDMSQDTILSLTLKTIVAAWGMEASGLQAASLEGVARLLQRHFNTIDWNRLVSTMAGMTGGAGGMVIRARELARLRRVRASFAVAQMLIDAYNHGLKSGSSKLLPPFSSR